MSIIELEQKKSQYLEKIKQLRLEVFDDGAHILYVNGECQSESPLGRLMHDFFCSDPNDMYSDVLAERVCFFKEDEKGVATMSKVMEEIRKDGEV